MYNLRQCDILCHSDCTHTFNLQFQRMRHSDCTHTFNVQFQTMRHAEAYLAGRYYLYEFDENLEIVNIPRQIMPYAIVEFKTKPEEGSKDFSRPTQPVMRSISDLPTTK